MVAVERRLEGISTGYSVFEKDQVLTHEQLNSVAEYADDQIRLTRVGLLGVGIACGLRATFSGGSVRVSRGIGVTTDGDLAYLPQELAFNRFKPYDQTYPAYAPLYVSGTVPGTKIPAYELVQGTGDPRGVSLAQFAAQAGRSVDSMTALLLVESYDKDDDLCSGTDCDNLGAEAINTLKVLLVESPAATSLQQGIATPSQAFNALADIAASRPNFPATITTPAALAAVYRTACTTIHNTLIAALPTINASAGAFLSDVVGTGTAAAWTTRLNQYRTVFTGSGVGIQYYYDFLKDVAETFNEFREHLFGDFTTCAPAAETFPKHLLLGDLAPGANPEANRTGFYPSPLTGRSAGELDHARFLLRRLDALITHFQVDTAPSVPIRITPSAFEDRPIDDRAIPFYYTPGGTDPIQRRWSYRLVRRGMDAYTYSYHAGSWGTQSGAADPLATQLGRYSFFRIEGHVGKPVATALAALEAEVRTRNLPFVVRSVHLGTDAAKVVKKPGLRITDLHHIHQIVRRDLSRRLEEAESFNTSFTRNLSAAVTSKLIDDRADDYETVTINQTASQKSGQVAGSAGAARTKLYQSYANYQPHSDTWQRDYTETVRAASEYKYYVSPVVKTEFPSPFDTLISHTLAEWIPWLEQVIAFKEGRADQKLIFANFVADHPQVEHFGGVTRGGTFVLLHDDTNTVVADFMLPYAWLEQPIETQEPTLTGPDARPNVVVTDGVKILPSRVTLMEREWVKKFKPQIDLEIDWRPHVDQYFEAQSKLFDERFSLQTKLFEDRLDVQAQYMDDVKNFYTESFKESMDLVTNLPSFSQTQTPELGVTQQFEDKILEVMTLEANTRIATIDTITAELAKEGLAEEVVANLEGMLAVAEQDLAVTIQNTATYVADAGVDVSAGKEGFSTIVTLADAKTRLSDATLVKSVETNLTTTATSAPALTGSMLNAVFKLGGFGG